MSFSGETWGKVKKWTLKEIERAQLNPMTEKGTWNAETNTPTLTQGSGTNGWWYTCIKEGTQFGYDFKIGDVIKFDGSISQWIKIAYTSSLKGEKGDKGDAGDNATITGMTATVDDKVGTPEVEVEVGGTEKARSFKLNFKNLRGEDCEITSSQATIDNKIGIPQIDLVMGGTPTKRTLTFNFKNMKGEKGEQGENAVTALNPRGDYDPQADPTYKKTDYISYSDGNSYVCKKDNPNNVSPTTGRQDDEFWQLIALRGAKGEKGDAGGISDDESSKLVQMNETKYKVTKAKLFNLNQDESHILFNGTLRTPKKDMSDDAYEILNLPHNENLAYPNALTVQTTTPVGYRTNLAMRNRFYTPNGVFINGTKVTVDGTEGDVLGIKIIDTEKVVVDANRVIIDSNSYPWGNYGSNQGFLEDFTSMANYNWVERISFHNQREAFDNAYHNGEINFIIYMAYGTPTLVYATSDLTYNTTNDYVDKDEIENKKYNIISWKPILISDGQGGYITTYDKRGNAVIAAEETEAITLAFGETKTIYITDMSGEDKGFVDGGASYQFGDQTGKILYDENGNPVAKANTLTQYHKVKPVQVSINKEYIYRSILHSKGCNVDEQGRICDFGLVSDPNFTFAVGSYLTDSNISETTTGNVEKAPYGFQGDVNVQLINYEKTSSSVIALVHTTDPVYTLTSDITIVEGKNYYTRTGTEGSYTYTKVETPRLEDIANYYEITAEAIHKAYISGSNTVESIFISSLF